MDKCIFEEQYLMENDDFFFDYTSKTDDVAEKISEDDGSGNGHTIHFTSSHYLLATPRYGHGFYLAKSYISRRFDNKYKVPHNIRLYRILSRLVVEPSIQDPRMLNIKETANTCTEYDLPLIDMQNGYSLIKPYLRAYILRKYSKIVHPGDYYLQKTYIESESYFRNALAAFQANWMMRIKRSRVAISEIDNYDSINTNKEFYDVTFRTINEKLPILKNADSLSVETSTVPTTYSTLKILDDIIKKYNNIIHHIDFIGIYEDGVEVAEKHINEIRNLIAFNTISKNSKGYLASVKVKIYFKD